MYNGCYTRLSSDWSLHGWRFNTAVKVPEKTLQLNYDACFDSHALVTAVATAVGVTQNHPIEGIALCGSVNASWSMQCNLEPIAFATCNAIPGKHTFEEWQDLLEAKATPEERAELHFMLLKYDARNFVVLRCVRFAKEHDVITQLVALAVEANLFTTGNCLRLSKTIRNLAASYYPENNCFSHIVDSKVTVDEKQFWPLALHNGTRCTVPELLMKLEKDSESDQQLDFGYAYLDGDVLDMYEKRADTARADAKTARKRRREQLKEEPG